MDIQKLVSEMTLMEKAGLCSGADFWHTKPVERLGVPACMMCDGPHGLRKQCDTAGDHLGVNDSIEAVCFPAGCAAAASFDRALLRTLGGAIGDGCRAENVALILGPAVNIKRSPLCGRNFEYYSEDPLLAGELAAAYTHGVQSRHVGVSLKHFACNNQEHRRMSSSSEVDERTLREIYLTPFEIPVKRAKPWTVMCSYNRINGVFSAENRWLLTDLLRNEWGFDGFVVTDWGAVCDRVKGIQAGLELEMPSSNGMRDRKIVEAVQNGTLQESALNTACERILTVLYRYLDHVRPGDSDTWDKEAQHALAADIAADCMVLLKNEGGALPLDRSKKVAFIGHFAKAPRYQGGGSSHIHSFRVTSALDAAEAEKLPYLYAPGYLPDSDAMAEEMLDEAVQAAREAETAVVFAGLPDSYESEGYDRRHMRLPDAQNRLIEAVAAANPHTVVVLHNGSPVEMPWIDRVQGVLEAYLCGQAVGTAVIRVLYGAVDPSGRLAETFPVKLEDNPSYLYYGGERNTAEYREGVFVGYRYYDKKRMDVLFPFGHGLSYTSFTYANLTLSAGSIDDTDTLTVTVDVTNTGDRAGNEVVQLYVGNPDGEAIRPVRELRGFDKLSLQPGETKTATFTLDKRAFAYWDTRIHDWYVESGVYTVEIGRSSRDIVMRRPVTVRSTVTVPHGKYDENTIFAEICEDAAAMAAAMPMIEAIGGTLLPQGAESSAAREAISEEMLKAMLGDMPLRAILGFSGGCVTEAQLQEFLRAING